MLLIYLMHSMPIKTTKQINKVLLSEILTFVHWPDIINSRKLVAS